MMSRKPIQPAKVFAVLSAIVSVTSLGLAIEAFATEQSDPPVWHLVLIKAKEGQQERLEQFIALNWLKPDEIAYQKGYIIGYKIFRSADKKEKWDVAVITMYASREAYNNIDKKYEPIMKAHSKQLIDNLDFKGLGNVVESRVMTSIPGMP